MREQSSATATTSPATTTATSGHPKGTVIDRTIEKGPHDILYCPACVGNDPQPSGREHHLKRPRDGTTDEHIPTKRGHASRPIVQGHRIEGHGAPSDFPVAVGFHHKKASGHITDGRDTVLVGGYSDEHAKRESNLRANS
jgi:hypothetical protein